MSTKSKYLLTFLVVLGIIIPACLLGRDVIAPAVYRSKVDKLALDTSPGSIGSPAEEGIPVVSTLAEMEENSRFVLRNLESEAWGANQGGTIGGVYYFKVTLEDGTVLAARYNAEAMDRAYSYEGTVRTDYDHVTKIYPIGTLRPWPQAAQGEAETADWLTYRAGWLDAEGDFGVELPDLQAIRRGWTVGLGIGALVFSIALCMVVEARLERKAGRS